MVKGNKAEKQMDTVNKTGDKSVCGIALLMVFVGVLFLSVSILYKKQDIWGRENDNSDKMSVNASESAGEIEGMETIDTIENFPYNRVFVEQFSYGGHEVSFYQPRGVSLQPEDLTVEAALDKAEMWIKKACDKDVCNLPIEICYYWYNSQHTFEICYDVPETLWVDYSIMMNATTGVIYEYYNLTQAKIPETSMNQYRILTMDTPMEERDGHKKKYQALVENIVKDMELDVAEYTGLTLENMGFAENNANYYIMSVHCVLEDGKNAVFGINQVDKSLCFYNVG